HPKIALTKQTTNDSQAVQWRLWIGSRNLTRDLSWDVGLSLSGAPAATGVEIAGIPELGHTLAFHSRLPGVSPSHVRSELRQVRWTPPPGCTIHNLHLTDDSLRQLPAIPDRLQKLIVVSPFLDGKIIGALGKWGNAGTSRILVSTLTE